MNSNSIQSFSDENYFTCMTCSNKHDLITSSNRFRIRNLKTGVCLKKIDTFLFSADSITLNHKATQIIYSSYSSIHLIDIKNGKCLNSFVAHDAKICCLLPVKDETNLL
jgi:hypothetical protein